MSLLDEQQQNAWRTAVAGDAEYQLIARWTDATIQLCDDTSSYTYTVNAFGLRPRDDTAKMIVLHGSNHAWTDFLADPPPPHAHNLLAMDRRRDDFTIAAGREELIANLRVLNRVMDLMRAAAHPGTNA